jgi:hypothetical protein
MPNTFTLVCALWLDTIFTSGKPSIPSRKPEPKNRVSASPARPGISDQPPCPLRMLRCSLPPS